MKDLLLDCKTALGLAKHMAVREGYDEAVYDTCVQAINEALRIHDVVGQGEQLVCDYKYHNRDIKTNGECTKCESHKWR